jgi:hypothetical protein
MTATKTVVRKRATSPIAAEGGVCLFSGEPTSSKRSRFLPGHDAKLKSVLLNVHRGNAKMNEIPKPAMRILKSGETLVGFKLDGDTVKIVGNFTAGKVRAPKAEVPAPRSKTAKTAKTTKTAKTAEKTTRRRRRSAEAVESEAVA